jgi:putative endonuclease
LEENESAEVKLPENRNRTIGMWGENIAADYIRFQGYEILRRNYRTREGEIDIIAKKDKCIVFIEVKTRTSNAMGFPEEAVTDEKMEHIAEVGQIFLSEDGNNSVSWRIDVISVTGTPGSKHPQIEWFENES